MSEIVRVRVSDHLPEPISHYTDAVHAQGWMWISGLLALDRHGALIGGDDVEKQAERVHENLKAVLGEVGATFADVVKVGVYLLRIEDRAAVNTVRQRYFGAARPASTLVQVSAFVVPGALLEIDAVARIPHPEPRGGKA